MSPDEQEERRRWASARFWAQAAREAGVISKDDRGFLTIFYPSDLQPETVRQFRRALEKYGREIAEIMNCR